MAAVARLLIILEFILRIGDAFGLNQTQLAFGRKWLFGGAKQINNVWRSVIRVRN